MPASVPNMLGFNLCSKAMREERLIITPILQMWKLRPREVKQLVQGRTGRQELSCSLNPGHLAQGLVKDMVVSHCPRAEVTCRPDLAADVCVQPHSGLIYLFFIEVAVSTKGQEMTHKNLVSGSPWQVRTSEESSGPDPMGAIP